MISIERLVHIKVVLTEKTKALLREEYERKAQYVHMELEQWRFQRKKY
ncbi:YlqD family protein [Brevibacillus laterosporus]